MARIAVRLEPGTAATHKALGLALEYAGQYGPVLNSYLAALERDPDHWASIVNIGDLHVARGDYGLARDWYDRARRAGGDAVQTALKLGRAETGLGRHTSAMRWYRSVLDREPLHPQAAAGLARAYLYAGDLDAALSGCEQILERLPDDVHCGIVRGEVLIAAARWKEAARAFEAVSRVAPPKWSAYVEFRSRQAAFMLDPAQRDRLSAFVAKAHRQHGQGHAAMKYWSLAAASALLGETDEAMRFLDRARAEGWTNWNWTVSSRHLPGCGGIRALRPI